MKHGSPFIAVVVLALVAIALAYNYTNQESAPVEFPAPIPATATVPLEHPTIPTVPAWPEFSCQEDEIMEWVDARNTAHCVNIEEFFVRELEKRVE